VADVANKGGSPNGGQGGDATASLSQLSALYRRRWRTIGLTTCVCVAAAVAYAFSATPKYRSQVQLFVATQPSLAASTLDLEQGGQFTASRVLSYVNLAKSPAITQPVVAALSLHMTASQLGNEITATVPADTVLINIAVTDTSPRRARNIAAAVAQRLVQFVEILEKPKNGPSPVKLSVSSPAQVPVAPASPRKKLDIALGAVLGVLLGFAVALLRNRADRTVADVDELKENWRVPVLATVPNSSRVVSRRKSAASPSPDALAARFEALRHLRTSLNFISVDNPPDSLVLTSSLPGEGKSTIAVALAEVVAAAGQSVVLVDGDLRQPSVGTYLGLPPRRGFTDVVLDQDLLESVLAQHPRFPIMQILLAGTPVPNPSELLSSQRAGELIRALRARADLVIIDAPPLGPVTDAAVLAVRASGTLVVVEPRAVPRRALRDTLRHLELVNAHVLGLVANKIRGTGGMYGASEYYRYLSRSWDGAPEVEAVRNGQPSIEHVPHDDSRPPREKD
jgi:tyrosine-protein kinase